MIKVRKNKRSHLDLTEPVPYSGELTVGPEHSRELTYEQLCARMTFTADGNSPEEVKQDIRRQVEDAYRDINLKLPNLGGKLKRIAEFKIMNLRTVYAPPHPIRTVHDALHYLRSTVDDTVSCEECGHWFGVEEGVRCTDTFTKIEWLGCPECGQPVERWKKL